MAPILAKTFFFLGLVAQAVSKPMLIARQDAISTTAEASATVDAATLTATVDMDEFYEMANVTYVSE